MKKIISFMLAFTIAAGIGINTAYAENGLSEKEIINHVTDEAGISIEDIDTDNMFIAESSYYAQLGTNAEPTITFMIIPAKNKGVTYAASIKNNKYVRCYNLKDLGELLTPLEDFDREQACYYAYENGLGEPEEIKVYMNLDRVLSYNYLVKVGTGEYIIPYYYSDESLYNVTNDAACNLDIGVAYTTDEYISICKYEEEMYNQYMAKKRRNEEKINPSYNIDENKDAVIPEDKKVNIPKEQDDKLKQMYQNYKNTHTVCNDIDTAIELIKEDFEKFGAENGFVMHYVADSLDYALEGKSDYDFSQEEDRAFSQLGKTNRDNFLDMITDIFKWADKNKNPNSDKLKNDTSAVENYMCIEYKRPDEEENNLSIQLKEHIFSWSWGTDEYFIPLVSDKYYIDNPKELIEYINKKYKNVFPQECYKTYKIKQLESNYKNYGWDGVFDYDKMTFQGKKAEVLEELSFEFKADSENKKCYTVQEVAKVGDTIKCKIQQIKFNYDYARGNETVYAYLFVMEGSKGRRIMWKETPDIIDYSSVKRMRARMDFTENYEVRNKSFIGNFNIAHIGNLRISGTAENDTITNVHFSYPYKIILTKFSSDGVAEIDGKNVKYKYYLDSWEDNHARNLYTLFCQDEEAEKILIAERKKAEEERNYDPAHIETVLKSDGENKKDYEILYAMQVKPDIEKGLAPKWYQELGNDTKATVVCIAPKQNGKMKSPYVLVRIKGNKGSRWFSDNMVDSLYNDECTKESIKIEFNSLLSFDGITMVRNSLQYDSIYADFKFSVGKHPDDDINYETGVFEGVTFEIDGVRLEFTPDCIDYVGNGRSIYKNMNFDPKFVEKGLMIW